MSEDIERPCSFFRRAKLLFIRADASPRIGMGHVMRCLALAQAWQEVGGQATFLMTTETPMLAARLTAEGMDVARLLAAQPGSTQDAQQTACLAQQNEADWVVVDGYHFDADYQQAIKKANLPLLFVDDYGHASHYYADLVLNQNIHADESLYASREQYTRLLLGTRYTLLRREFWPWRSWRHEVPPVARQVLVTLGGADPDNVTLKVIQALSQVHVGGLEAVVVVGSSNPHREALRSAVGYSGCAIHMEHNVVEMPALMAWADLAISAGGSTCWELALMGVPSLLLVLADNQQLVAEGLDAAGAAVNLGRPALLAPADIARALTELALAPEKRATIARRGQELTDGAGAARVVRWMWEQELTLRPVQADDCHLIWEWANDPVTRVASFSSESIRWETHVEWFTAKLTDPHSLFYIALDATGTPVGQIRYHIEGQEAVVSAGLAPDQRGRGYGSRIIRLASQQVFENTTVSLIHAYIKLDNAASARAFSKAGFATISPVEVQGHPALHLLLRKDLLP